VWREVRVAGLAVMIEVTFLWSYAQRCSVDHGEPVAMVRVKRAVMAIPGSRNAREAVWLPLAGGGGCWRGAGVAGGWLEVG
jgi:hypothetical protein